MEFMRGTKLSDVWMELDEPDIVSVLRQLTQLESCMMSISFPAGGSLYYTKDLEKKGTERTSIPLNDDRYCRSSMKEGRLTGTKSSRRRTTLRISNATFSSYFRSPPRTQPSIILISATPISSRATSSCRICQTLNS